MNLKTIFLNVYSNSNLISLFIYPERNTYNPILVSDKMIIIELFLYNYTLQYFYIRFTNNEKITDIYTYLLRNRNISEIYKFKILSTIKKFVNFILKIKKFLNFNLFQNPCFMLCFFKNKFLFEDKYQKMLFSHA